MGPIVIQPFDVEPLLTALCRDEIHAFGPVGRIFVVCFTDISTRSSVVLPETCTAVVLVSYSQ